MIVLDKPKLRFLLAGRTITVTVNHDRSGRTSKTAKHPVIVSWPERKIGRQEMVPPDALTPQPIQAPERSGA